MTTAVFGTNACVTALREHSFATAGVQLQIEHVNPVHRVFPTVVNESRYDVAELAIVTVLQALDAGRPLCLLPVTLLGRFQHHTLVTIAGSGIASVADLAGRRIGVRSWTQTTGVWVRGILADEPDFDPGRVEWVVYEPGHLAGFPDPDYVQRAPDGSRLPADLLAGEVDAAILGNELPDDPRTRTVLPDPARAAAAWYGRTGAVPLNHMVVVSDALAGKNPALVRELGIVLAGAMPGTPRISSSPNYFPSGFDAVAPSLDLVGRYAFEQGIISRPIGADEVRAKTEQLSGLNLGKLV